MVQPELDALNTLFAMPWADLIHQDSADANSNLDPLRAWRADTGKQTVADVLHYEASLYVASAGLTISASNPPGYTQVDNNVVAVAAPRQGTWSIELACTLEGKF